MGIMVILLLMGNAGFIPSTERAIQQCRRKLGSEQTKTLNPKTPKTLRLELANGGRCFFLHSSPISGPKRRQCLDRSTL